MAGSIEARAVIRECVVSSASQCLRELKSLPAMLQEVVVRKFRAKASVPVRHKFEMKDAKHSRGFMMIG
jgi:hypothetical protein